MNYLELTFIVNPKEQGNDILIAHLSELAFESFVETENGFCAYIPEEKFDEDEMKNLIFPFSEYLKFSFSSKSIEQQNWNKEWESSFQPIEVQGKCYIRAPFHPSKKGFLYDVIIEPKMSFGTGHHRTTQLMIQKLMLLNVKNCSLLDMGCGTGVLAIVASMMGADPITAVDIDEWSFENTIENCKKNNINNVLVHKGNAQFLEGKLFHTILANINKNVLLSDLTKYVHSLEKKGNLILSGFFETDVDEILAKASELGLNFEGKVVSDQWTMLHFIN